MGKAVGVGVGVGTGVIVGVGCAVAVGTGWEVGVAEGAGATAAPAWPAKVAEGVAASEVGAITWVGREATGAVGVAARCAGAGSCVGVWPDLVAVDTGAGPAVGPHPAADSSSNINPDSPSSSRWSFSQSGIRPPCLPSRNLPPEFNLKAGMAQEEDFCPIELGSPRER